MSDTYIFKILRFDPSQNKIPFFQEFRVDKIRESMTVLDGLYFILNNIDGSLAFRSSCRAAVCGSCAMHINGRYRLACETQISGEHVTIRPLSHLPVIKDLVVDLSPFWAKYRKIKPYLIAKEPPSGREKPQSAAERENLNLIIDCILCSACYASCPMTDSDPDYLGPAAITKANRFVVDSRDSHQDERLLIAGDDHGIFRCHTAFNCSEVCPKKIDPAGSIAHLKRLFVSRRLFHFKKS
jgi:succinate dehydrogenase / fumarate reductase iron-sulfur subunit